MGWKGTEKTSSFKIWPQVGLSPKFQGKPTPIKNLINKLFCSTQILKNLGKFVFLKYGRICLTIQNLKNWVKIKLHLISDILNIFLRFVSSIAQLVWPFMYKPIMYRSWIKHRYEAVNLHCLLATFSLCCKGWTLCKKLA